MKARIAVLLVALINTPTAFAVDCVGKVSALSLQLNTYGTVTLSLTGGPSRVYLCNIDGQINRNGVSPKVCQAMYSTLMAAKLANKNVLLHFYDYNSCSAIPVWTDAGALGWTDLLLD